MAADNKSLGRFDLMGIPPAPRGVPQIEVTFDIDANGIVNVSARDLGTGKEQKIAVTGSSNLNKDEIERMRKEAEKHAAEDQKRFEEIETVNQADSLVYTSEKTLKDFEGKIDKKHIDEVKKHIDELKGLLAKDKKDVSALKKKLEETNKAFQAAATELYQKAGAQKGAKPEEDVVDAEVVKEKKGKA